ncbi:MAG: hypothetical protein ACRDZP_02960 [Acidimicrobiales bacterium]
MWLLREVLDRRERGDEVTVVSPDTLSVAHRYLVGPSAGTGLEITRDARGCELVYIQLEPGLPVRLRASRPERITALLALAAVLKRLPATIVLRLHHLDDLAGGPGGRAALQLWRVAERIEVGDEETRASIADTFPELSARLLVAMGTPKVPSADLDGCGESADVTAEQVMALVRSRSAAERESLDERESGRRPNVTSPGHRIGQWQWLPAPGAGVPEWTAERGNVPTDAGPFSRRMVRSLVLAADRRPLTRPLARGARIARELTGRR